MNRHFLETAHLLARVAPHVFEDGTFALKGGTAINLFIRDMPRLSVDLDLAFLDHSVPRNEALAEIDQSMRQAVARLKKKGYQATAPTTEVGATRMLVREGRIQVKIETNFVMRGTLHPVRHTSLMPAASEALQLDLEIPVASMEDVYGGKLVAAMDRQHPRDLFDVLHLFANEGITPEIRRAFVVYLACSNRPVHEILFPALRDIRHDYENNFLGMMTEDVPLEALLATRDRMVHELQHGLSPEEKQFLVSLVNANPQWSDLGIDHLDQLPGVRWKLHNLEQLKKINPVKFAQQAEALTLQLAAIGPAADLGQSAPSAQPEPLPARAIAPQPKGPSL